jgi:hypothetical protein
MPLGINGGSGYGVPNGSIMLLLAETSTMTNGFIGSVLKTLCMQNRDVRNSIKYRQRWKVDWKNCRVNILVSIWKNLTREAISAGVSTINAFVTSPRRPDHLRIKLCRLSGR